VSRISKDRPLFAANFLIFGKMLLAQPLQPLWFRRTYLAKIIAEPNAQAAQPNVFVNSLQ
jgi:hypothetical protein